VQGLQGLEGRLLIYIQIKKSKPRAGGTAGAAVHPKTTDPTSWEVELPW
jgi:hypothetical protein